MGLLPDNRGHETPVDVIAGAGRLHALVIRRDVVALGTKRALDYMRVRRQVFLAQFLVLLCRHKLIEPFIDVAVERVPGIVEHPRAREVLPHPRAQ